MVEAIQFKFPSISVPFAHDRHTIDKQIPSGLRLLWPKSVVYAKKLLGGDRKNGALLPLCNSFVTPSPQRRERPCSFHS